MIEFSAVDKAQITHILLAGCLLGVVRDESEERTVSEFWWYNPWDRSCGSSRSRDPAEKADHHTVSEATDYLWRNRGLLWICGKASTFLSGRHGKV